MLAASLALAGCAGSGGPLTDPVGPDKVVYHLNEGLAQATNGLRNIRNHLEVNPKAQIVVVAHAQGVDYLMKGKKDAAGNPYEVIVQDLKSQGVKFDVCEITLRNRKLSKDQFIEEVGLRPLGRRRNHAPAAARGVLLPAALSFSPLRLGYHQADEQNAASRAGPLARADREPADRGPGRAHAHAAHAGVARRRGHARRRLPAARHGRQPPGTRAPGGIHRQGRGHRAGAAGRAAIGGAAAMRFAACSTARRAMPS